MDFFILIRNLIIAITLFVALLVGLLSAPWQVLLIILIAGIVMSQWLIQRLHLEGEIRDIGSLNTVEASTTASEGLEATDLSATEQRYPSALSYRGASYTPIADAVEKVISTDASETSTSETPGKYRGGLSALHIAHIDH